MAFLLIILLTASEGFLRRQKNCQKKEGRKKISKTGKKNFLKKQKSYEESHNKEKVVLRFH
jgi:hypothetical protein